MEAGRLGSFIRDQRTKARLSLRSMSILAGVSIAYLSQVERGLRKPSAEMLQAIAKGLRISAETLYVQAGILEDRPAPDVVAALHADPTISPRHRQTMLEIYEAFRQEDGESLAGAGANGESRKTAKSANGKSGKKSAVKKEV